MTEPIWRKLEIKSGLQTDQALALKTDQVLANPPALWTLVCEYIKGPIKLKIEAAGDWEYTRALSCGPDGTRAAGFFSDALIATAPLGALIGKVGGSPAEKPDSRSATFVAGSYAVIVLDEKTEGALFLTMNDQVGHFEAHDKFVTITIHTARSDGK